MKPMKRNLQARDHEVFQGDFEREQDGFLSELAPHEEIVFSLEDTIVNEQERLTESGIRMLLTSGGI